jgi:UDP-N-acetylmuramoyl-tripeptide--D-alanyl-D-alanine ligase
VSFLFYLKKKKHFKEKGLCVLKICFYICAIFKTIMISTEYLYTIYLQHPEITTDTRKLTPECFFFALKGDNFDGNKFASTALEQGASYVVVDDPSVCINDQYLLVYDVLTSLQALAKHHRKQFDIPVIGITGSNGKTTTKELLSAVLSAHYATHFTKGNLNNHIGVPLTLLSMPKGTEVAVIEMGANHVGEIDFLCNIALPTHGIITNIGKAHLEGFGGLKGVKQAKSELYRFLQKHKGLVFINKDEKYLSQLSKTNDKKIFYKATTEIKDTNYTAKLVDEFPFLKIQFETDQKELITINSQLIGKYNFNNIMTSICLGNYFKVPDLKIKQAIEAYLPGNNRSQIVKMNTNTYILDAYNANPSSMKNALENFKKVKKQPKIAILGDMRELGLESTKEHQALYNYAQKCKIDKLFFVGTEFDKIKSSKTLQNTWHFSDVAACKVWLLSQTITDTIFLIKGSRGIKLETLLN